MQEYKVTVNVRNQSGLLPDVVGKTHSFYEKAESAQSLKDKVDREMRNNFGYELDYEGMYYSVEINKV
jgi:hypothetical protein